MKLTKDEIEEIVTEAEREVVTGPMFGAKESLRRVLTRKFGEKNPYGNWSEKIDALTHYGVPVAAVHLVPELWAAAEAVEKSRDPNEPLSLASGIEWPEFSKRLRALRAVLKRIDEVKP